MALHPICTSSEEINRVLNSKEIKEFNMEMKRVLDIEDMSYVVELEKSPRDQEGYVIENKLASTIPDFSLYKVKRIVFYTENITRYINSSFSRIYNTQVFEKVIEVTICCILLHELVHVQQIKQKKLTKKIYDREAKKPYEKRTYEIAADLVIAEIMNHTDKFTVKVCELFTTRKCATNEDVEILIKTFNSNMEK
ncbi:hypothetical protein SporoP8_13445 [Sporosarcina ureae]|uniref:hypothetical protein n=1 Tax=Sporosarcina TaxID=1569 RepID=UPI000A157457|nr:MULTISPECIES: hypothetical protein [Sporosarcina]ARJ39791.1 hypothetical protein SporoP8_13445 [Sporosarcina ureae]PIC82033.1 hypothetical protein CSV73_14480 [Sporosarcina sp. P1]